MAAEYGRATIMGKAQDSWVRVSGLTLDHGTGGQ